MRAVQGRWKIEPIYPLHRHPLDNIKHCKKVPRAGRCLVEHAINLSSVVRNHDNEVAVMRISGWRLGLPRRPKWIEDYLDTLTPEQVLALEKPPAGVPDDEVIDSGPYMVDADHVAS